MMAPSRHQAEPAAASDVVIEVVVESPKWRALPDAAAIVLRAISLASAEAPVANSLRRRGAEVAVLLCDDTAIAALNARWRGYAGPTNVLSFPAAQSPEAATESVPETTSLGDIAIAYETVAREAEMQRKPVADHLAHLAIHGFLHLLGYDHVRATEAEAMERTERAILRRLAIPDPYRLPTVS
jgi:probable rRNA maturation factor